MNQEMEGVRIRGMRPEEFPAAKEVVARSFDAHLRENPAALEEYEREPWYDPDHLLVAEVEGRVVSQMGIRDGSLWIAGQAFPAGLVGTVCTLPEYRGKGIGARMLQGAFAWMDRRGIALSYLHTSEARYGFYGRQGYRLGVLHRPDAILQAPPVEPSGVRVRRAGPEDAKACNGLYEAYFGRMSGAWSRTPGFWLRRLSGAPKLWFRGIPEFWVAEMGALAAYGAILRKPSVRVIELAAAPGREEAVQALVGRWAREANAASLEASLSPREPLWRALAACRPEDRSGSGHVLVRVQDRGRFLEGARAVLGPRLQEAGLSCTLVFAEGGEPFRVGGKGRSLSIRLSIHDFCTLLYNGARLPALRDAGAIESGANEADLRMVFPETYAARCALDGY